MLKKHFLLLLLLSIAAFPLLFKLRKLKIRLLSFYSGFSGNSKKECFAKPWKQVFSHLQVTWHTRPDFAELDVFLGQHILLTLEQHFNPKM